MSWGMRIPNRDRQLVNGKWQAYKNQKKMVWSSEVLPDNQDDQGQDSSLFKDMMCNRLFGELGEDIGVETNDRVTGG